VKSDGSPEKEDLTQPKGPEKQKKKEAFGYTLLALIQPFYLSSPRPTSSERWWSSLATQPSLSAS
jgi:hypothetical protein